VRDVVEAFRLLDVAMQQSATDHATGKIDFTRLSSSCSFIPVTIVFVDDDTFVNH
jgi:DNA replicative helicase MCM subunit Mcm2 (Cdc46/Mcm family)